MKELHWFRSFDGSPIAFDNFESCIAYFGGQDYQDYLKSPHMLWDFPKLAEIYLYYAEIWSENGTKN